MMTRPTIGITTYGRNEHGYFTLPGEYVDAVRRAGGSAVLLPPGEHVAHDWLTRVDGLILAGGGDIDPCHYNGSGHATLYMVDEERDRTEIDLAARALATEMPILAICRGAQVLNIALGGTLHAHLPDVVGESVAHRMPPRQPTTHVITVSTGSRLAGILGDTTFDAASWHHQAIDRVAPLLDVVGQAPDGTVEAVEMRDHPWFVAVQWHPELTAATDAIQQRLFDALATASAEAND